MAKAKKGAKASVAKAAKAAVVRQSLEERTRTRMAAEGYQPEEIEKMVALLTKRTRRTSVAVPLPRTQAGIIVTDDKVRELFGANQAGPFVMKVRKGRKSGVVLFIMLAAK